MTLDDRIRTITAARSICWEVHGDKTPDWSDAQCLLRAAVHVSVTDPKNRDEYLGYLDLAEEIAGEAV